MNDRPRPPQLLDRSHVAMDERARQELRVVAKVTCVLRADPALRAFGTIGASLVPVNRISTAEREAMDEGRLHNRIRRSLHRHALSNHGGTPMGDKRTSNSRYLLSKNRGR